MPDVGGGGVREVGGEGVADNMPAAAAHGSASCEDHGSAGAPGLSACGGSPWGADWASSASIASSYTSWNRRKASHEVFAPLPKRPAKTEATQAVSGTPLLFVRPDEALRPTTSARFFAHFAESIVPRFYSR